MQNLRWRLVAAALSAMCLTVVACAKDPHAAMLEYTASGDQYLAQGKLQEAILEYRNAVQQEPTSGEARLKLAKAYVKAGDAARAAEEYVRAADLLPDVQVQLDAGNVLLLIGRFDDAKVRAEKALAADPKKVEAQILLANALAGLKDVDGAVAELEEAIRLNPDRAATYTNLGALELGRGKREEAEKAFARAVELDPTSPTARIALGNFYWLTGRQAEGESQLAEALKLAPDEVLPHRAMATFYLATRQPDRAETHLRRIYELSKSPAAALALADYYIARRNEAGAREILQPLSEAPQTAAAANVRLAALDRSSSQAKAAYDRLATVLTSDPGNLQALLLKSSFLMEDGKLDEALTAATEAVTAHADSPAAQYAVGRIQAARNEPDAAIAAFQEVVRLNPRANDAKVALARLQLSSGKTDASVGLAQEALTADPRNANAQLVLVQGLIARGDLNRAQHELDALATRFPDSPAVHAEMGMLLGRKQQLAGARKEFERALQLQPDFLRATAGLVALDLAERHLDAARARVDALTAKPDASSAALMLAARTYAGLGDPETSEQTLKRVLARDESYLPAYGALGQLYARQGQLDAALAQFETLAARNPKPVVPLTLAGMILEAQGKRDKAKAHFERVMELDPQAAVAANNLAWLYVETGGNLDVALQLAQTAKRKLPDTPEVNDTLGFIYYKKGLADLAVPVLQAAVSKDQNNPTYHYHLGLAYAKAGNTAQARASLEKALSVKSDFAGAEDARTQLASLEEGR